MGKSTPLLFTAVAALLFSGASATLDPIVIKGSKFFFNSNDTQFFIKGVAYQAGFNPSGVSGVSAGNTSTQYTDPLADEDACTRDVPELVKLGANAIRTYAIDPTKDHTKCMALLDAAGIYVISDLSEPSTSIDRANPAWTTDLLSRYTSVVDALAPYTNVIGFFAGNEVPNNSTYSGSAAMVKAAVRDTKAYIKSKNYRAIGVGYAADDGASVRAQVASYLNCGDVADTIDFWGYNIYEWCGDSDFETSGYSDRVKEFSAYSVPTFFAEYGCNTGDSPAGAAGRKFSEVAALYGNQMTPVFSGGIVYEYFEEENDFGLVKVDADSSSVSTVADFTAFATAMASVSPSGVQKGSYNPSNTAAACPTVGSDWNAATSLPPTPNKDVCACMMSSLKCTAKSSLDSDNVGPLFDFLYGTGKVNNSGIVANTTTGIYGAYSMCDATQRLSWLMNSYYTGLNSDSTACDFGGNATVVSSPSAASTCSSIIAAATSANSGSSPGTGSSGAASSTSKKSDGGMTVGATLGLSTAFTVSFTLIAALTGAGMILL